MGEFKREYGLWISDKASRPDETFSVAIAVAKASAEQGDNKSLKVLKISKGLSPKLI